MATNQFFRDRICAGKQLATAIEHVLSQVGLSNQPIVYALPRGGVPVAAEVAKLLDCPLAIVVAKKISLPENPELAIGAVTTDGQVLWDEEPTRFHLDSNQQQAALSSALIKAQLQLDQLAPACPQVNPEGAVAILVDDGIATGMTMAVAALALRAQHPIEVWICAPVAPLSLIPWLQQWGDRLVLLETPQTFLSVSRFYAEFPQVEIDEVLACLDYRK